MAKSGIFASLGYSLFVQHYLVKTSYLNTKLQEMAKAVPASVYIHWRDTAEKEFPGIKTKPENFAVSCNALLQFFHISAIEKTPLMLPSKAADSVWHAWLAHDKEGLTSFLQTYLGQNVAHVEKNAMVEQGPGNPFERMANTWRAAHDYENNVQFHGKLPDIFEADKITGIPTGFWYDRDENDRREGCFYNIDEKGNPGSEKFGEQMLSWPHIYEGMTPARKLKADAQIIVPYKEPTEAEVPNKHAAIMASLGIVLGTTAALYLADQVTKQDALIATNEGMLLVGWGNDAFGASGGDFGGGGDGGGSSCGGGCGGG